MKTRALANALAAFAALLTVYFAVVGLLSGPDYARAQFAAYGDFLVSLAAGFGIQVGLYTYLRRLVGVHGASRNVVAASGTSSTAAMVSCCAHYLVNLLPVLGATGLVTLAAQYQVQFFWVGIAFNLAGIAFVLSKVMQATKEHARCTAAPA